MSIKKDFIKYLEVYTDENCTYCAEVMVEIMKAVKSKKPYALVIRPDENMHGNVTHFHFSKD